MVIFAATERGGQVTGNLILQAVNEGLLRPGTPFFEAASTMTFEKTRQLTISILDASNRSFMISHELRKPSPGSR